MNRQVLFLVGFLLLSILALEVESVHFFTRGSKRKPARIGFGSRQQGRYGSRKSRYRMRGRGRYGKSEIAEQEQDFFQEDNLQDFRKKDLSSQAENE